MKFKGIIEADIIVEGLVQGVSFRAYTNRKARSFGLTGFVENLPNGTVHIVAQGKREDIMKLIKWLRTKGSPASDVTAVKIDWNQKTNTYNSFKIKF